MRYVDFVQDVLRLVLRDRPAFAPLSIHEMASELGFDRGDRQILEGIWTALFDLARKGIVGPHWDEFNVKVPADSRRYQTEPLSELWPGLFDSYLDADEEQFLASLAQLSEAEDDRAPTVRLIDAKEVFARLAWPWDQDRAIRVFLNLEKDLFIAGRAYATLIEARVTYWGLVRAHARADTAGDRAPTSALRRPGRPKGTRTFTRTQIVDAYRRLRMASGRQPTKPELCNALVPRITVRTLGEHLKDFGLGWPIE